MKKLVTSTSTFLAVLKGRRASILVVIVILVCILLCVLSPFIVPLPEQSNLSVEDFVSQNNKRGELLETNTGRIYIETEGSSKDPAIVLVHGLGGSSVTWRKFAPEISKKGYYVISIDLPPFGLSEKDATKALTHEALAQTIKQVLDFKEIQKATFIGHSMGVNILLWYYKQYPEMVDRFVFIDGHNSNGEDLQHTRLLLGNQYFFQLGRQFLQRALSKERVSSLLRSATYKDEFVTDELLSAYMETYKIKDWDAGFLAFTRDSQGNDIPDNFLKTISVPTLIVWGKEDSWIPLQKGISFSKYFIAGDLVVFPDVGHLPMEEAHALFSLTISNFLEKENSRVEQIK